jgi:hypothetical protein
MADGLAKKSGGGRRERGITQMDMGVSFKEAKTLIKDRYKSKWEKEQHGYNKEER